MNEQTECGIELMRSLEAAGLSVSGDALDFNVFATSEDGNTHNCNVTLSGTQLTICSPESIEELSVKNRTVGIERATAAIMKILKPPERSNYADGYDDADDAESGLENLVTDSQGSYMYAEGTSDYFDDYARQEEARGPPQALLRDAERCRAFLLMRHSQISSTPSLSSAAEGSTSAFEPSVAVRPVGGGYWITVETLIPKCISESVATAWGLRLDVPLQIRLQFDGGYPGCKPPKVQIFQHCTKPNDCKSDEDTDEYYDECSNKVDPATNDGRFPLGQQLTRALNGYLQRRWSRDGANDSEHFNPLGPSEAHIRRIKALSCRDDTHDGTDNTSHSAIPLLAPDVRARLIRQREHIVSSLRFLGFSQLECEEAALRHTSAVDAAQFLLYPAKSTGAWQGELIR